MGVSVSSFVPSQTLVFHIASGVEGSAALTAAERQDGYLAQVQRNRENREARKTMNYAANRLTMSQVDILNDKIKEFLPHIPPVLRTLKPTIVPLMPSADGGMPHTRPADLVCLPQSASSLTLTTFVHELWHLHQRAHYREWTHFFEKKWKWRIFDGQMDPALEKMRRLNPDTLEDPLWIWDNKWVPVCLFLNPSNPTFQDTATYFYNAQSGMRYTSLPPEMAAFFSTSLSPSAYEHPCETSAYMITGPAVECPAYKELIGYWTQGALIQ
jgi:hypothetical protein